MNSVKPFAEWIGRQTTDEDIVSEGLVERFRAIFGPHLAALPGGVAPLGIHWCLSPYIAPMDGLGEDGHPAKFQHLPALPLPRRMWAGGAVESVDLLRVGDRVRRTSTIAEITRKQGKSGELWFVAVDHVYFTERGAAIQERQNIVYREAAKPTPLSSERVHDSVSAARKHGTSWTVPTPPTLLFRYSAITFNGHRIHYDLPYAVDVEGYEGLVVHGPLQATLLYNLAARDSGAVPTNFKYRGVSTAIGGRDLTVCAGQQGDANRYWTQEASGLVLMEAVIDV